MRQLALIFIALTVFRGALFAQVATQSDLVQRDIQAWQDKMNEQASLNARLDALEYEYRDPTPDEVEAMQRKWAAANPLAFSGTMPDFSKQRIRVRKIDAATAQSRADAQELAEHIQALEQQMAELKARSTPATNPSPAQRTAVAPQPAQQHGPLKPNPSSITMRKLSDGQVIAIIGDKQMRFKNEAEANSYADKIRAEYAVLPAAVKP